MTRLTSEIDWGDVYSLCDYDLPTNWRPVVSLDADASYEWETLHAFYSPTDRRYYWASGSGCSCNYWGMDLHTVSDFESGDKAALRRALLTFADDSYRIEPGMLVDAIDTLARFRPAAVEVPR